MSLERVAVEKEQYDGKEYFLDILNKEFPQVLLSNKSDYPLKLWAAYKLSKSKIDVDVSKWAMQSYIADYSFLKDASLQQQDKLEYKFELVKEGRIFRADTMTSFANYIRRYIILSQSIRNIGGERSAHLVLNGEIDLSGEKELIRFAQLTHSKGNLMPVPLKFNVERSGQFADSDFWDITMYEIFQWCKTGDQRHINLLLNRYGNNKHFAESMYHFKKWMSIFNHNWHSFVKQNHLQSFVNQSDNDWRPIEFWSDHFAFNRKINTLSLAELRESLQIINACIEKRNTEISNGILAL